MKKIIVLFIFALVLLPQLSMAETVASDNFVLHDRSGKMTAELTTSGEGTPALFMFDSHGVIRVSIGLYPDGAPGVVLNDDKGLAGAILRLVESKGDPVLVLKENGQDRYIATKNTAMTMLPQFVVIIFTILVSVIGSACTTAYILRKRLPQQTPPI
jgi:hypothetical protein